MVCLGAHFSAIWIVVANSWMQTPAGYHIVGEGPAARAEITDFWGMVFNPSSMDRLSHVLAGAWQAGAALVVSVSAWYLVKNRHTEFALKSLRVGITLGLAAALLQLVTGHESAKGVARYQPAKLAAYEGLYQTTTNAALNLFGWVNDEQERLEYDVSLPGGLSWLIHGTAAAPVRGLSEFRREDRPPVGGAFLSYHGMVAIGLGLIALNGLGFVHAWRGTLQSRRWLLLLLVVGVLGPQLGNQLGWFAAEVGRQPWLVYGLLRTAEGLSKVVDAPLVMVSLILFSLVYVLLFAVFIYLLNDKIQHGPDAADLTPAGKLGMPQVPA